MTMCRRPSVVANSNVGIMQSQTLSEFLHHDSLLCVSVTLRDSLFLYVGILHWHLDVPHSTWLQSDQVLLACGGT